VEVLHKCAEVLAPSLGKLTNYADWLEAHPFRYIAATDRLGERWG